MLTNCYARIAVPSFFAITGFLLADKLSKANIKKQTKRLWILYGAWSVCYLPLIINSFAVDVRYENVKFLIKFLIFVRRFFLVYSWTPLWYILASCYCIPIIYWILKHIKLEIALLTTLSIYLFMACSRDCYSWIGRRIIEDNTILYFGDTWLFKIGTIWSGISMGVFFMLLGKWIHRRQKIYTGKIIYNLLGLAVSIILLRCEVEWHQMHGINDMSMMLSLIPCVYFVLNIFSNLQLKDNKCYEWLRNMSIMVYGLHTIVGTYMPTLTNSLLNYFMIMMVVVIVATILIWLSKKKCFGGLKYLY